MRYLLFVLCIFIATHSFAQVELLGSFVTGFRGMGSECITFVGKDSFYFDAGYCADVVRGKGRCEIRDNMLYLFFEKASEDSSARLPVLKLNDYVGHKVNKGEVWFYEIDECSEDLIMMKPAKSTEDFRRYTKKRYNETSR